MAKVHDRILELAVLCDESDDFVSVTAINYYRNRAHYADSDAEAIAHTAGAAAATHEVVLNQLLPPPTHIILASTFQA
jgi:hypothetical protein